MAQLSDLLPAALQDKAKAVAGALVILAGVVVINVPAIADSPYWRIAVGILTLLAGTGAVFATTDPRVKAGQVAQGTLRQLTEDASPQGFYNGRSGSLIDTSGARHDGIDDVPYEPPAAPGPTD